MTPAATRGHDLYRVVGADSHPFADTLGLLCMPCVARVGGGGLARCAAALAGDVADLVRGEQRPHDARLRGGNHGENDI
jgi:hypothetical protein